MRILVLWADEKSSNLGVRALAVGTTALAQRVWPGAETTFLSFGMRRPEFPLGTFGSMAREWVTGRRGMRRWLASFDLAIDTRAGDSFSDSYGLRRMGIMSAVAESTRLSGTPVILGPQTIGPFTTRRGRMLGCQSLRTARAVIARDSASEHYARQHGRSVDARSSDVVFALPSRPRTGERDVLLNVSGLLWEENPHVDAAAYRTKVRDLIEGMLAEGREVSLLAHVLDSDAADNDVPVARMLGAEWGLPVVVPSGLDDVRGVVASSRLVVASRMHACLNALSVGTPAIPLAYSRKFAPLLADLQWDATVDLRTEPDPASAVVRLMREVDLEANASAVAERARASFAEAELALGRAL
ncbi:polysaccharide pyruvyl transferase family protein [Salinibacterium sp. dk2585]|uniref:polysaccharide pyruvyl transferase family protein n=1 Tax=unclassified Salinibacterium TaxID=2632331 RepID=UPI0011C24F8C|nr:MULTISPECIES: polysaccharide pyruvyl transferase family protein [unclassified Salinibacterium]QEE60493.1 polysaccharide pyruvyl transferase family protein [Salinibacterium sp. dk2585]TXK55565.1 polysaccharide pyruvyl transferase family protein [Salinibacterium sp. dk5596]